jgi:hypothetical protein
VPPQFRNQPKREDLQILEYSTVVEQDHDSLDPWGKVLQRVIKAIVSIKGTKLRTFDTEYAGLYQGTGFVVDRTRGIILSNRDIVSPGPITASLSSGITRKSVLSNSFIHSFVLITLACSCLRRATTYWFYSISCSPFFIASFSLSPQFYPRPLSIILTSLCFL